MNQEKVRELVWQLDRAIGQQPWTLPRTVVGACRGLTDELLAACNEPEGDPEPAAPGQHPRRYGGPRIDAKVTNEYWNRYRKAAEESYPDFRDVTAAAMACRMGEYEVLLGHALAFLEDAVRTNSVRLKTIRAALGNLKP